GGGARPGCRLGGEVLAVTLGARRWGGVHVGPVVLTAQELQRSLGPAGPEVPVPVGDAGQDAKRDVAAHTSSSGSGAASKPARACGMASTAGSNPNPGRGSMMEPRASCPPAPTSRASMA